jgi:hypothetical protein
MVSDIDVVSRKTDRPTRLLAGIPEERPGVPASRPFGAAISLKQ